jgi:beta-galactosidase/beta-glucuronidase
MHPRPQLTRDRWTDLSGVWQFAFDDANIGLSQGWHERADVFDRTIRVPFPPESRASGIGDPSPHPVVWYRRAFPDVRRDREERLWLHFGAVDYRAQVWVNGRLAVEHEGGHTPFSADITSALAHGGDEHVVVVRAEDRPEDLAQPRGKQDWQPVPHRIWYHRTTGIWQPVWLEPLPATFISGLQWTPDLDRAQLRLDVRLDASPPRPLRLQIRLSLHGAPIAEVASHVGSVETSVAIGLNAAALVMDRDRWLWSPQHPNLVEAELVLLDEDQVIDAVHSYAGLRSVGVADGRFLLNGRSYYLRFVLEQGYWPESHLAAPAEQALRREVELAKELGFNGVRIHQKVEDPRFLAWCDRLGLLVWGEMANAYVYTPVAAERLIHEWLAVLRRDASHPCIVTWVPINESWGVPNVARDPAQQAFVQALYWLTKALDPARPVIGNDGWEHLVTDILGIHDYAVEGNVLRERYGSAEAVERTLRDVQPGPHPIVLPGFQHRGQPVMLTEFGGIINIEEAGAGAYGYGTVRGQEAFLARYADLVGAVLDCPTIAGFCYTQLTDTEQERNGLLTAERVPKLDPAAVRAITSRPSKAIPSEAIAAAQAASTSPA